MKKKLLELESHLHKMVIGQDEAIVAVSNAIRRNKAGISDEFRPIGSFIFAGPTGVGKTELAKSLARILFDDEKALTRIDMSEYMEKHSVSRLIGAPPGYVGYDEGGQLTEAVRRKPYSVVLLDEIEKAHPDVFNVLLQVLDDGRLTDNKGRVVDFKNTIIIMTSNAGSNIIQQNFEGVNEDQLSDVSDKTKKEVFHLLRQTIRPEFLNRIDDIIMFTPLSHHEIKQIVELQFLAIKKILKAKGLLIEVSDQAIEFIAKIGFDPLFGARPIKRLIQKNVLNELSKRILADDVNKDDIIKVDSDGETLRFTN